MDVGLGMVHIINVYIPPADLELANKLVGDIDQIIARIN